MSQLDDFLNIDNFKLAFIRLKTASKSLYKTIYMEDLRIFSFYLDDNIEMLIYNIKNDIYKPQKGHKIYIPKKDNLVRPLTMLNFIDMLVYQALLNVIADKTHDLISPYYNKTLFANYVNPSTAKGNNKNFFYQSWKRRWKNYNKISKGHFNNGYVYLSEFDIASFFDTIDHNILCELLRNDYHIEEDILSLLSNCLEVWTEDHNHNSFKSKHGIPQGPLSSVFLGELYLFYLDKEIQRRTNKLDYKYLRYVDDIRIFSKDKKISQKLIAGLDLISRDLGLIPQSSKIAIKKVENIEKEIKILNSQFSEITKEYKEDNLGKPEYSLKKSTHKKLKKRFLNCFKENSNEVYFDKTIISFALYKLNKDDEIKNLLLSSYSSLLTHFEGILFYLKKHYSIDEDITNFILQNLNDEHILFNHLIAMIFKYFPEFPFNEKIYNLYMFENGYWLTQYYMISWLKENHKKDLILMLPQTNNYFINRELNYKKYFLIDDNISNNIHSKNLMKDTNEMTALQGLYLLSHTTGYTFNIEEDKNHNPYIKYIAERLFPDIINITIKDEWKIENSESFFNTRYWNDEREYEELRTSFLYFIKTVRTDPSKSVLNLNIFNSLIFNKICYLLSKPLSASEYGVNLDAKILDEEFPLCNKYWMEINEKRNQRTEAHPHDKFGNIRIRITVPESVDLFYKEKKTIEEICNYKNFP
jgi:hypothetical protein